MSVHCIKQKRVTKCASSFFQIQWIKSYLPLIVIYLLWRTSHCMCFTRSCLSKGKCCTGISKITNELNDECMVSLFQLYSTLFCSIDDSILIWSIRNVLIGWFGFMVFNTTFNKFYWWVTGENHRSVANRWQTLSHNVVSSTPHHEQGSNSQH